MVLARHGEGDLALEIKVLLTADVENAIQAVWRLGDDRVGITADKSVIGQHGLPGAKTLLDGDIRSLALDIDDSKRCRATRDVARGCDDGEDRLAVKHHALGGER